MGFGRSDALQLLEEWTKSESLRKHGIAVSICTEAYGRREAARLGLRGAEADAFAEPYACAGLLHDMDYERHPSLDEHPFVGWAICASWAGRRQCSTRFWRTRTIQE